MSEIEVIKLTFDDLNKLKLIGSGTDGAVYQYNRNTLVKLYHKKAKNILCSKNENDEDIKIFDRNNLEVNNGYFEDMNYYANDGDDSVKLSPKDAIYKAIERQKDVSLTSLPKGAVYLNSRFAGCVLTKQNGIQVHKLTGTSLHFRKKVFLNILKANMELLKNNIYHCDLSNSPYNLAKMDDGTLIKGHSHVLVSPATKKIEIIDLDGKSTIYTEKKNENYISSNALQLNILALEFLLQIDYETYKDYLEEIEEDLNEYNIKDDLKDKLVNLSASQEELEKLTLYLQKR